MAAESEEDKTPRVLLVINYKVKDLAKKKNYKVTTNHYVLSIVFQKNTNYGIPHAGIGLYYTRVFKGGIIKEAIWSDINKNQLGLEWDLGWRFHGLDLSVYGRYQFNHITDGTIDPNTAHLRNFYSGVRLSYYFL